MAGRFGGPLFNQFAIAIRAWVLLGDESDCPRAQPNEYSGSHSRHGAEGHTRLSARRVRNLPEPTRFAKYAKVAETLADLQNRGLKKIGFINNELFVTP
jgi:hypothetical protein